MEKISDPMGHIRFRVENGGGITAFIEVFGNLPR
jgi:hypothetical protein